jgi:hypothetical protein
MAAGFFQVLIPACYLCDCHGRVLLTLQVILNGSQSMHAVSDDGVSVDSANGSETLHIRTLDSALVSPGKATPFPNGVYSPCMAEGVHFNLVNNVWGTNYIMWTPYSDKDIDVAFRFSLSVKQNIRSRGQRLAGEEL